VGAVLRRRARPGPAPDHGDHNDGDEQVSRPTCADRDRRHPAHPAGAEPDGERILTWRQIYDLPKLPDHLVVIGSGVTGAEFASATPRWASRSRWCPAGPGAAARDADAAAVLEDVFAERGTTLVKHARAERVVRIGDEVVVRLADAGRSRRASADDRRIRAQHGRYRAGAGRHRDRAGRVHLVDRVSRTSVSGIYAPATAPPADAGLVAQMQGRIAMWHALGEGVAPIKLKTVAANVFTHPEIANVGISQQAIDSGAVPARTVMLPLATNARGQDGRAAPGLCEGVLPTATACDRRCRGAPNASELILPIALACRTSSPSSTSR